MSQITHSDLTGVFHLPLAEAASVLGVGSTALKKACRRHGIMQWPYRRLKKLSLLIESLKHELATSQSEQLKERYRARLAKLKEEEHRIFQPDLRTLVSPDEIGAPRGGSEHRAHEAGDGRHGLDDRERTRERHRDDGAMAAQHAGEAPYIMMALAAEAESQHREVCGGSGASSSHRMEDVRETRSEHYEMGAEERCQPRPILSRSTQVPSLPPLTVGRSRSSGALMDPAVGGGRAHHPAHVHASAPHTGGYTSHARPSYSTPAHYFSSTASSTVSSVTMHSSSAPASPGTSPLVSPFQSPRSGTASPDDMEVQPRTATHSYPRSLPTSPRRLFFPAFTGSPPQATAFSAPSSPQARRLMHGVAMAQGGPPSAEQRAGYRRSADEHQYDRHWSRRPLWHDGAAHDGDSMVVEEDSSCVPMPLPPLDLSNVGDRAKQDVMEPDPFHRS